MFEKNHLLALLLQTKQSIDRTFQQQRQNIRPLRKQGGMAEKNRPGHPILAGDGGSVGGNHHQFSCLNFILQHHRRGRIHLGHLNQIHPARTGVTIQQGIEFLCMLGMHQNIDRDSFTQIGNNPANLHVAHMRAQNQNPLPLLDLSLYRFPAMVFDIIERYRTAPGRKFIDDGIGKADEMQEAAIQSGMN